MRILSNEELTLVAGGNASSDDYTMGSGGPNGDGTGYGGGAGNGGTAGQFVWIFLPGSVIDDPDGIGGTVTASSGYWEHVPQSDNYGGYGGSGSTGTSIDGEQYAQWQAWAGGAAFDFIVNLLSDRAATALDREVRISNTFDPTQVVRNIQGMDRNGNIERGWQMQDGSAFFDTNGNGVPDYRLWTDPAGNVWADEGDGRHLVRAAS